MFTHLEAFLYKPQLFEALWASTAIVVADIESGDIIAASPLLLDMFGYHADDLIGQPVDLLVPPDVRAQHAAHRASYSASPTLRPMGTPRMFLHGVRKDGTRFPVSIQLSPTVIDSRRIVLATVLRTDASDGF